MAKHRKYWVSSKTRATRESQATDIVPENASRARAQDHLFICWSGARSRRVAQALYTHLPALLPGLTPFISLEIPKGVQWFDVIGSKLATTRAGLICLTPENLDAPWLHFEAGALALHLESKERRIFTYLYEVSPSELRMPLAAYQSTQATEAETKRLIAELAGITDSAPPDDKVWAKKWPELARAMAAPSELLEVLPAFERFFQRKTFIEPLDACTGQTWLARIAGARETLVELQRLQSNVELNCRPYLQGLFQELTAQLDGYAMDMESLLVETRRFDINKHGRLNIQPVGILQACENRRQHVLDLVAELLDPGSAPVVDDAWTYQQLTTFAERKTLIHRHERAIEHDAAAYRRLDANRMAESDWAFDRIVYYLMQERGIMVEPQGLLDSVRREMERVRSADSGVTLVPLHYALRACGTLAANNQMTTAQKKQLKRLAADVRRHLDSSPNLDRGRQLHDLINALDMLPGERSKT